MCGLIGHTGHSRGAFEAAFRSLIHRGPDGSQLYTEGPVCLAHCRLAIIDVSERGLQPMSNASGTVSLVFNGEIYNYRELKSDLEAHGKSFRTETDTEVIIQGYEQEGVAFFSRMRGMWALGLHDAVAGKIVLSRDYFGIKPLLWSVVNRELAFASEMRAMKKLLDTVTPNTGAYYQFFNLGYFAGSETCYREVRRLKPGEIIIWDTASKSIETKQLEHPIPAQEAKTYSFEESYARVEQALLGSVDAHFVSDVPVGLLLSGGNDSSLIAALAVRTGRTPIAYTLDIEGSIDGAYAKEVAEHLHLPHERVPMTLKAFEEGYEEAWSVLDEPFADSSIIPTSLIYRAIKGRTKVVLSGEGGDELFGGYVRHRALASLRRLYPFHVGDTLFSLYGTSAFALSAIHPLLSRVRRTTEQWSGDLVGSYLSQVRLMDFPLQNARVRHMLSKHYHTHSDSLLAEPPSLFFDRILYLPYDLLYKTDMASMASSIETRVPFLDREVLATLGTIDPGYCLSPRYTDKKIVKKIAENYLPSKLVYRPKKGFSFSFKRYAGTQFENDVRKALEFHRTNASAFGLTGERVYDLMDAKLAPLLILKYPSFTFALVSNWKVHRDIL